MSETNRIEIGASDEALEIIGGKGIKVVVIDGALALIEEKEDPRITLLKNTPVPKTSFFADAHQGITPIMTKQEWERFINE